MQPRHLPLAVFCALVWGFVFVVISWGLRELPPLLFTALRFASCAILLPLIGFQRPAAWRHIIGVGVFLGICQFGLLFLSMAMGLPAGLASLVMQTQAFFTVLLAAVLYRQIPAPWQVAGLLLAALGIGVIAAGLPGEGTRLGLILCLMAALSWAAANLVMRKAQATNALHLMIWMSLIPPIPLALLSLIFEGTAGFVALGHLSPLGWFAILYNGWVATLLAFGAWSFLLHRYPPVLVAPFSLLVPVFGMVLAWLLLGEALTPTKYAAGAVILAGLALVVFNAAPRRSD